MFYPNITSLVPEGEYFNEEALMNEACLLTVGHLDSIEQAIAGHVSALDAATAGHADLNAQIASLQTQLETATATTADLQAQLGHRDAEVETLNAQVVELKAKAAGSFSSTTRDEDTPPADPKAKYLTSYDIEARKYAGIK